MKDWVLTYPDIARRPEEQLKPGRMKSVSDYLAALPKCAMTSAANGMFHPVALRDMGYWVVPDFARFRDAMTPEQRAQATAALLFTSYIAAEEGFSPMLNMLGGHPNFMADLKFPLAASAFLFPDHPNAREWREQYQKFMELCGHFYVRPAVPGWEGEAGRFTESIATYNWAFMGPTSEANWMGLHSGSENVYATPELADMGDYLVGILTAPMSLDAGKANGPADTPLTWSNGFKRIHPPQGAHSGQRGAGGPMYTMGEQLERYRPLTAEHMMWGAYPSAGEGFEDRPGQQPAGVINRGTNPHLASAKYTGYGVVLRAGVDTPDEVAVFLQQIDKGPNYRWGYANQNGSGDIYYYAKGKSYSGHGFEDAGDRHADDAFYTCNTGVYKNYHFNCIGMNELIRPFYDLEVAQFAELVPQTGAGAYSWPEYQSRSVMLVGTEYAITYDSILDPCGTRFAWNSAGVHDQLPFIQMIKGGTENTMETDSQARDKAHGVIYDVWKGGGDRMALVTHLGDVKAVQPKPRKGQPPLPYCHVQTSSGEDYVFEDHQTLDWAGAGFVFQGTAGVIRLRKSHQTELALFHGIKIGASQVILSVDNPDLGVSAAYSRPDEIAGVCFGRNGGTLTLETPGVGQFYLDGATLQPARPGAYRLPPGKHRWEFTNRLPEPMPPTMVRTENYSGGARVYFTTVAGAEKYRLEISRDDGASWQPAGEVTGGEIALAGLPNGIKVHVRAVASNASRESRPAKEYPLYVNDQPPLPPDGLKLGIGSGQVRVTWGEVLGVKEYRLYRRARGGVYEEICRGRRNSYEATVVNPVPAFSEPGMVASTFRNAADSTVYEYAVASVNDNGQGARSLPVDTDPTSWRNWNPTKDLRFKRQTAFWLPPYVDPKEVPPLHYDP